MAKDIKTNRKKHMKKFTLYLGLNDKDSKVQEVSTIEAYKMAQNILKAHNADNTIFEAQGMYTHEDGTLVIETTLRIELLFIDIETVKRIVSTLKAVFNQESVAVQMQTVESVLM